MRVAVLFNDDPNLAHGTAADAAAVQAAAAMAHEVAAACTRNGWEARALAAPAAPAELLDLLQAEPPDVVFNLIEAVAGRASLEAAVIGLLDLTGIPYTGSPAMACALALDKPTARVLFAGCGVPIPAGRVLERGDESLDGLSAPFIVKPAREDASHGITRGSVAVDSAQAQRQAQWVIATYGQPALVEEFVDGREFNLAILDGLHGPQPLPPAEIDYSRLPADHPPLLTYEAKWDEASPIYRQTPPVPARDLDPSTRQRLEQAALAAYRALHLRDYGRIDLRLDRRRGPLVLEGNANPDLSPGAGLAQAAARAGIPYDDLIARIVRAAHRRGGAGTRAARSAPAA